MEAVGDALKQTPRASSMVENLNSRLRNYFFLRSFGDSYLSLLQFFVTTAAFLGLGRPNGWEKAQFADRPASSTSVGAAGL